MSDTEYNDKSATVLPFRKPSRFLEDPRPEVIKAIFMLDGEIRTAATLSIGVALRTYDNAGLKIVPTREVLFAIGDESNPERTTFSIPADMLRDMMVQRFPEFIEACKQ